MSMKSVADKLAQPCARIIDLRGVSAKKCMPVKHGLFTHFLDELSLKVFKLALKKYNDEYTLGVYETVMQAELLLKQAVEQALDLPPVSEPSTPANAPIELIPFGYYSNRKELRIQMGMALQVMTPDGLKLVAELKNISVTGLQISFAWISELEIGGLLQIQFPLFDELRKGGFGFIPYQIKGRDYDYHNKQTFLRLALVESGDTVAFADFLSQFIESKKYRYRIDTADDIREFLSGAYERLYAPQMMAVQFFTDATQSNPPIDFVVYNPRNVELFCHFINPFGQVDLTPLLTEENLKQLLVRRKQQSELLLYTFSLNHGGQVVHYCATASALKSSGVAQTFFAIGRAQESWRIYKLLLTPSHRLTDKQIAKSSSHLEQAPRQVAQDLLAQIKRLTHNGCILDVTAQLSALIPSLQPKHSVEELQGFITHFESNNQTRFFELGAKISRMERRHQHTTAVEMAYAGQLYTGETLDFSTGGTQIKLDSPSPLVRGNTVLLSFVNLQKKFKKVPLTQLVYQVMAIKQQGHVLALKRIGHAQDEVAHFFERLIDQNRDKLPIDFGDALDSFSRELLHLLVCETLQTLPFFIQRERGTAAHYIVSKIATSDVMHSILDFFRVDEGKMDFSPITNESLIHEATAVVLNEKSPDAYFETELYMYRLENAEGHSVIEYRYAAQLADPSERLTFLQRAKQAAAHYFVKIHIVPCRASKHVEYNALFQQIRRAAVHKADEIKEELNAVVAMGELIDMTKEISLREGL